MERKLNYTYLIAKKYLKLSKQRSPKFPPYKVPSPSTGTFKPLHREAAKRPTLTVTKLTGINPCTGKGVSPTGAHMDKTPTQTTARISEETRVIITLALYGKLQIKQSSWRSLLEAHGQPVLLGTWGHALCPNCSSLPSASALQQKANRHLSYIHVWKSTLPLIQDHYHPEVLNTH